MAKPVPRSLQTDSSFFCSFPRRQILEKIRKMILPLSVLFASVLAKHMNSEFEVQIRSGDLTLDSRTKLIEMESDFRVLQFQEEIGKIFRDARNDLKTHTLYQHPYIYGLLNVVEDECILWFKEIIVQEHGKCLKNRRKQNTKLCKEKCSMGPNIFNFTGVEISEELNQLLKNGLNDVPKIATSKEEIFIDLQEEIKVAAKNLYFSYYGVYPQTSKESLDKTILSILSQCTSNSTIIPALISLRDNFVENIPFFLSSINERKIKASDLLKLLPNNCIITPSDKQVGISILPYAWYIKEYNSQLEKGGHEKVNISEEKCVAILLNKITDFKNNCSKVQNSILIKHWPKNKEDKHRIGVLKLVPKVNFHSFINFLKIKFVF